MEDLVATVVELLGVRSTADRPAELHRALEMVLSVFSTTDFRVRRFESRGKPSALVTASAQPGRPRVILNAHLDVVPGTDEQFRPVIDGDRLYGRGAHDMKAAAVVLATVFREVAGSLPYPIALQLVTDEEVGGFDGTGHQLGQGVRGDFVIIGEQSGLRVVTESKGLVHARLIASGRAAHAAYPWTGDNALVTLIGAIGRVLERYPVPAAEAWATTVNVARITTGNTAINQVPADATAWLDIRCPPSDPVTAERLAEIAGPDVAVVVDARGAPHHADPSSPSVLALRAAARAAGYPGTLLRKHGAADGRFYSALGIDAVIFGPDGDGQHGPSEYVSISSLRPYHDALTAFLATVPVSPGDRPGSAG
ncbi:M20/M25/M40 family metallo-hydrolase [Actinoplanes sp. NPDC051851]|uniref:M20 family metallopeptidase n=1 Tax=Actinoplanes sp. NPDC051851 TaxID=3154753 RepID=UPI00342C0AE4